MGVLPEVFSRSVHAAGQPWDVVTLPEEPAPARELATDVDPSLFELARAFDASAWEPYTPKRGKYAGQTVRRSKATGRIVYTPWPASGGGPSSPRAPGGGGEAPLAPPPKQPPAPKPPAPKAPRTQRATVQEVSQAIAQAKAGGYAAEHVKGAIDALLTLRVEDLQSLKKELSLRGGGRKKDDLIAFIKERALGGKPPAAQPEGSPAATPSPAPQESDPFKGGKDPGRRPALTAPGDPYVGTARAADEPKVWEAFRKAEQVERQRFTSGEASNVKIPELYDRVKAEVPNLTPEQFHGLLWKWAREDKLTLGQVNDPHLEPRTAEMPRIPDAEGSAAIRGYVDLRDQHALRGGTPSAAVTPEQRQALLRALERHPSTRKGEPVHLSDLAKATGMDRDTLHRTMDDLRRTGEVTASGYEGRQGAHPGAAYHKPEDGTQIAYLERRPGPKQEEAPAAPPAPTAAPKPPAQPRTPKAPATPPSGGPTPPSHPQGGPTPPSHPQPPKPPQEMDSAEAASWANQSSPGKRGGPDSPLRTALGQVYDDLNLLVEYKRDGLVDLPTLFDRTKRLIPNLTPEEFKSEVKSWWEQHQGGGHTGRARLHIHNEQHTLTPEQRAMQIEIPDPHNPGETTPLYYLYLPRSWSK